MKAVATASEMEKQPYSADSIIRFDEGLIGFADYKNFVLMEKAEIAPFRRLQSTERQDLAFLVLDPSLVVKSFNRMIPDREWESLGLTDPRRRLALAICTLGATPGESTGNFQAPLVINYETMEGRQLILTEPGLMARHPLL